MKPSRPYILKAIYEWLLDNELTPHILVDTTKNNVAVPSQFIQDDQIILNIQPSAIRDFYMGDDAVAFNARFAGQPMDIYVPMAAILAIYARENGQGMGFGSEPAAEFYLQSESPSTEVDMVNAQEKVEADKKPKKPALKVVK